MAAHTAITWYLDDVFSSSACHAPVGTLEIKFSVSRLFILIIIDSSLLMKIYMLKFPP